MVIVGAGGHAKDLLVHFHDLFDVFSDRVCFFDDVNIHENSSFGKFRVIKTEAEVKEAFIKDNAFLLALGGVNLRRKLFNKFSHLGGVPFDLVSEDASVGKLDVTFGKGISVMPDVFVSNSVSIGLCALINFRAGVHHDSYIGDFCEISPGVQMLGGSKIEDFVFVGAGAIILPGVTVGRSSVVGAGSVVANNVPPNCVVLGNPAKIVRHI